MQWLDWTVMVAFLLLMVAIGWASKYLVKNTKDYFTGGGKMPWWLVGISHHMSGYSAVVFTAYAGIAYKYGFTIYFWWAVPISMACFLGVFVFAPRWSRLRTRYHIESPMEFIATRYDVPTQQLLAWWGVLLKILDVGAKWAAIGVIISTFTDIDLIWAILISVAVGLFYSTIGGLWAGTITDFVQFLVQFAAGVIMFIVAMLKLNEILGTHGIESLWKLWEHLPEGHSNCFAGPYDTTFTVGWLLVVILSFNGGTWNLAQRYIAAPTSKDAKKAAILSAALYLIWPLVLFFPMWAAPILVPNVDESLLNNNIYAMLVMKFLGPGMVGLMLASLVAHTLAMTTSDATAITAVVTRDIAPRIWKRAASFTEKESLFFARVVTFAFLAATAVIAFYKDSFGDIIGLVVSWYSAMLGAVAVPMILGLLPIFRRSNHIAAYASVFSGIVMFFVTKYNVLGITTEYANILGTKAEGVNMLVPVLTSLVVYCLVGLIFWTRGIPTKKESDDMLAAISSDEKVVPKSEIEI